MENFMALFVFVVYVEIMFIFGHQDFPPSEAKYTLSLSVSYKIKFS